MNFRFFFLFLQSKGYWKEGKLTQTSPEFAATEKPKNLTEKAIL